VLDQSPLAFPSSLCRALSVSVTMVELSLPERAPGYHDTDGALVVVGAIPLDSCGFHQP